MNLCECIKFITLSFFTVFKANIFNIAYISFYISDILYLFTFSCCVDYVHECLYCQFDLNRRPWMSKNDEYK